MQTPWSCLKVSRTFEASEGLAKNGKKSHRRLNHPHHLQTSTKEQKQNSFSNPKSWSYRPTRFFWSPHLGLPWPPKALPGHRAQKIAQISGPLHGGQAPLGWCPRRSRDRAAAQAAWTKNLRTESRQETWKKDTKRLVFKSWSCFSSLNFGRETYENQDWNALGFRLGDQSDTLNQVARHEMENKTNPNIPSGYLT